jgi:hypothetical protein
MSVEDADNPNLMRSRLVTDRSLDIVLTTGGQRVICDRTVVQI